MTSGRYASFATDGSPPLATRSSCGTRPRAPRPPASKATPYIAAALCQLRDGRLASGWYDSTIGLWDPITGAETARLEGHSGPVEALCLLSDGRLASGSDDGTIRLWDPTTGAETSRLEGHSSGVTALCVLPDGRLASGSDDHTIRLWDLTTGAETARLEIDAPVRCLITLSNIRFVAGDALGRFHRLEAGTGHRGSETGSRAERLIHNARFESGLPRKPDLPAK